MTDRERLIELINAFYMVGKPLYIITEQGKVVERIVRTFKYLDDLGIEFECTLWEKSRKGVAFVSTLKTNVVHSKEIGKTAFLTKEAAEQALKEREKNDR